MVGLDDLIFADELAGFFGVSKTTASRYTKRDNFPKPVRKHMFKTTGAAAWFLGEVNEWAWDNLTDPERPALRRDKRLTRQWSRRRPYIPAKKTQRYGFPRNDPAEQWLEANDPLYFSRRETYPATGPA